jgi:regulator of protease activity HflC (stomatin/prohibitin superfamily)
MAGAIVAIVIVVFLLIAFARTVRIIPQARAGKAIETVFTAIHEGKPDRQLLSYQYLQMLPQLAQGDANKVFVIPSEFADAFGGIAKAFAENSRGTELPTR